MASFVYVDNSNVWIEGMHVSAVKNGQAANILEAQQKNICDNNWNYDFGKLLEFAGGEKSTIKRAVLFGSRPPRNDTLWSIAEKSGYEVIVEDRSVYTNKEKKIDSGVVTAIMFDVLEKIDKDNDDIVLVAGDKDYVPPIDGLTQRGYKVYVCFWNHAAKELKEICTGFFELNPYLE